MTDMHTHHGPKHAKFFGNIGRHCLQSNTCLALAVFFLITHNYIVVYAQNGQIRQEGQSADSNSNPNKQSNVDQYIFDSSTCNSVCNSKERLDGNDKVAYYKCMIGNYCDNSCKSPPCGPICSLSTDEVITIYSNNILEQDIMLNRNINSISSSWESYVRNQSKEVALNVISTVNHSQQETRERMTHASFVLYSIGQYTKCNNDSAAAITLNKIRMQADNDFDKLKSVDVLLSRFLAFNKQPPCTACGDLTGLVGGVHGSVATGAIAGAAVGGMQAIVPTTPTLFDLNTQPSIEEINKAMEEITRSYSNPAK